MNELQKLIITAGPKVHERLYEGWFEWNGSGFPVSHGEIMRNPNFGPGGFSPDTLVMVTVRDDVLADGGNGLFPKKGDECTLQTLTEVLLLQVGEVGSGSGEVLHKLTLWDRNQGA